MGRMKEVFMQQREKFRCVHCGDRFGLDIDEFQAYIDGYYSMEPDTCHECCDMINHPPRDILELHSDADPGL